MSPGSTPDSAQLDPAEVAKFDSAAHRFWDPEGEFRTLHVLNPLRTRFIAERVTLTGSSALDVGCGGGLLAESLHRTGARVTGIDLAPGMIEVARLHAAANALPIDYRLESLANFVAQHRGSCDLVTCMEMLEHHPEPASVFPDLAAALKPGGSLFVSTLNRNLRSFLLAIVGAEYVTGLVPRGTHDYARMLKPSEIARFARAAGFELVDGAGLEYLPVTAQARLTDDLSVNYLLQFRKPCE